MAMSSLRSVLIVLPLLLSSAWTPRSFAQASACDDPPIGSGACLPWGFHRVSGIGEVRDLSRDGSALVGVLGSLGYPTDVTHYSLDIGLRSVDSEDVGGSYPGLPIGNIVTSANGRYVSLSAKINGEPVGEEFRAYRWDTDTGSIIRLPSGPTNHLTKFGWLNGYVEPSARVSISADGSVITGRGLAYDDQGDLRTDVYGFIWSEGAGTTDALQGPFDEVFVPNVISGDASTAAGSTVYVSSLPAIVEEAAEWKFGVGSSLHFFGTVSSRVTTSNHDGQLLAGTTTFFGTPSSVLWRRDVSAFEYMDGYFHPARFAYDGRLITGVNLNPAPPLGGAEPWIVHSDLPGAAYGEWFFSYVRDRSGIPLWFEQDPQSLYGSTDPILLTSESGHTFSMIGADWFVNVPPLNVVVMGDSYASGEGVGSYIPPSDGNKCHRSEKAFARVVGPPTSDYSFYTLTQNPLPVPAFTLDFIACSGAETKHITTHTWKNESAQIMQGKITEDTDLIIISIGGNDARFSDLIKSCMASDNCRFEQADGQIATWQGYLPNYIYNDVYESLVTTYTQIKAATVNQNATIVALLYPHPLVGDVCSDVSVLGGLGEISDVEQAWLREMTNLLNQRIVQAAFDAGIHSVNVFKEFKGHASCAPDSWFTEVQWITKNKKNASLHPTAAGHAAYANAIRRFLEDKDSYSNGAYASGMPRNP